MQGIHHVNSSQGLWLENVSVGRKFLTNLFFLASNLSVPTIVPSARVENCEDYLNVPVSSSTFQI